MATVKLTITNLGAGLDGSGNATGVEIPDLFIVQHEVTVKPSFSSTQVYGRMDPIFSYQNTVRSFTLNMKTGPNTKQNATIRKQINALHQMMYPLYQKEVNNLITTFTLKGPPILKIKCPGVFNSETIFVPENFSLTRGTANSEKVNVTIGNLGDLSSFQAPVDGYAFTIGGTILHENEPPGWISGSNGVINFSKGGDFPLGS
jgi:hypothetical protein